MLNNNNFFHSPKKNCHTLKDIDEDPYAFIAKKKGSLLTFAQRSSDNGLQWKKNSDLSCMLVNRRLYRNSFGQATKWFLRGDTFLFVGCIATPQYSHFVHIKGTYNSFAVWSRHISKQEAEIYQQLSSISFSFAFHDGDRIGKFHIQMPF